MNDKLRHLLFVVASLVGLVAMGAGSPMSAPEDYNPDNPPEPNPSYTLTILTDPSSLASPVCSAHRGGTEVSLTASSYKDYAFKGWVENGDTVSTDRNYSFVMPLRGVTLTAAYSYSPEGGDTGDYDPANPPEPASYQTLRILTEPSDLGQPRVSTHLVGQSVKKTASSYKDYDFKGWVEDGDTVSRSYQYEFVMPSYPLTLTAVYLYNPATFDPGDYDPANPPEPDPSATYHNLTIVTEPSSLAAPTVERHEEDEVITVSAPSYTDRDYSFLHWSINGEIVGLQRQYTFAMPHKATTIKATYEYAPSYNPPDPSEPGESHPARTTKLSARLHQVEPGTSMNARVEVKSEIYLNSVKFTIGFDPRIVVDTEGSYAETNGWEMTVTPVTNPSQSRGRGIAPRTEGGEGEQNRYVVEVTGMGSTSLTNGRELVIPVTVPEEVLQGEHLPVTITEAQQETTDGETYTANSEDGEIVAGGEILATSIVVDGGLGDGDRVMQLGDSSMFTVTIVPVEAAVFPVAWASNDTTIVTIDATGLARAVGVGKTTVTATTTDGSMLSATATVLVQYAPPTSVVVTPDTVVMTKSGTIDLTAKVNPEFAEQKVTWEVQQEGINIVSLSDVTDLTVKVRALLPGEAVVRASTYLNYVDVPITVKALIDSVTIVGGDRQVHLGSVTPLEAKISPDEANEIYHIGWSSSAPEIVEIDENGRITAKAVGAATITATVSEEPAYSTTCQITVVYAPSEDVIVTPDSVSVKMTHEVTLTAQVDPNVAEQRVTWSLLEGGSGIISLSDTTDLSIKVKGLKLGSATVRATSADGLHHSDVPVTVTTLVDSVRIAGGNRIVYLGSSTQLEAVISPEEAAAILGVTWTSSNPEVVSVDDNGTITANAIGTASVTATVNDGGGISHSVNVTVGYAPSEDVIVTPDSVSVKMTHEVTLTAQVDPNVAEQRVTWSLLEGGSGIISLSDMTDLSVKVKGLKLGNATVRATSADGRNHSDVPVTVTTLVDSVRIAGGNRIVYLGSSTQLEAVISPEEAAAILGVTWTSSNPEVVSVDDNGTITANAIGTATITATVDDGSGVSASCLVTVVYAPSQDVIVTPDSVGLRMKSSVTLTAQVDPEVAEQRVVWSVLEGGADIVTLSEVTDLTVKVTGERLGEAVVRATSADGLHSSDVPVTVTTMIDQLSIEGGDRTVYLGSSQQLTALILPEAAREYVGVTWSSADPAVVSVNADGTITANAIGNASITATANDGSGITATVIVTVVYAPSDDVVVTPGEATVKVTESVDLTAQVDPEFAEQRVTWSIQGNGGEYVTLSDISDLTVRVTGEAIGEAVIRATTADSRHTADVRVTVQTMIESLTITGGDREVILGSTNQLQAVITPSEAAARYGVTWASSNPAVLSVNETGMITAHAIGQATVTATANDGSGITAAITVTVVYAPSDGVLAEQNFVRIYVETSETLNVTVSPEFAEQRVSWTVEEGAENVAITATTDLSATVEGLELGTARIRATSADGNNHADIAIEVYTLEQSHGVSSAYDGRLLTLDCDTVADIYLSFDNVNFEVKSTEMMTPDVTRVYAYALSRHKLPSDTVEIEIPCFYDGAEMYLHRENSMEKALEWAGGEVQTPVLTVIGRMGGEDFRIVRDQTGVIGIDFSQTSVVGGPSLQGMNWLKWAALPEVADADGMFDGCEALAAVVYKGESRMAEGVINGVENPNLLVYVPEASMAPSGRGNVITGSEGSYRADRITLSDDDSTPNPYYAPYAFTADLISYTRNFAQETGYDQNTRGYESLMLPFDVETVTHPVNGACAPFKAERTNGEKPFWLYTMGAEIEAAASIEAYRPYLISMPNNDRHYFDDYILAGNITFAAANTQVEATPELAEGSHRGTMEPIAPFDGVYALNVGEVYEGHEEGSFWVNNYRGLRTFEAYIVMADGPNGMKIFDTAGIEEVTLPDGCDFKAWVDGGVICVVSSSDAECGVYDLAGTLTARLSLISGQTERTNPLARGVYIVRVGKQSVKIRL